MGKKAKFMIVAGEPSGDGHAARLVRALRETEPDTEFEFFGSAGESMKSEGVDAVVDAGRLAIIGGLEIARELPMFLGAFRKLKAAANERSPDAVLLIDFPDFNLRLARSLKKKGHRVIYYISPQVWAWKKFRVRHIRKYVDLLISILPFEKDFYEEHGFDRVAYAGSPIAAEVRAVRDRTAFRESHRIPAGARLVALLPGSRRVEIERILPEMLSAALRLKASDPGIRFVLPLASTRSLEEVVDAARASGLNREELRELVIVVKGETYDAVAASDAAAVASGTATLETAVLGTPMVIVYKASALNYALLRPLISIDTFGLVNLVAGRKVAKELIQRDFTPETLAREISMLLENDRNLEMRKELAEVKNALAGENASANAARLILDEIRAGQAPLAVSSDTSFSGSP